MTMSEDPQLTGIEKQMNMKTGHPGTVIHIRMKAGYGQAQARRILENILKGPARQMTYDPDTGRTTVSR